MTMPVSIRFRPDVLARLQQRARAAGTVPSTLAQRLVDEGLRLAEHPGVVFRDGPSGRRAGLVAGPDVAEVVVTMAMQVGGPQARARATAEMLTLRPGQVETALAYRAAFPEEIDAEVSAAATAREVALAQLGRADAG